jgi:hypothetical protein
MVENKIAKNLLHSVAVNELAFAQTTFTAFHSIPQIFLTHFI